jgi:hypothetical protein
VLKHTPCARPSQGELVPASPLMSLVSDHRLAVTFYFSHLPPSLYTASVGGAAPHRLCLISLPCPIESPLLPRRRALGEVAGAMRRGVACASLAGSVTPSVPALPATASSFLPLFATRRSTCHVLAGPLGSRVVRAVPSSGDVAPRPAPPYSARLFSSLRWGRE